MILIFIAIKNKHKGVDTGYKKFKLDAVIFIVWIRFPLERRVKKVSMAMETQGLFEKTME